jgi:hypothetical protein
MAATPVYVYEVELRRGKEIVEKSVSCLANFSVGEFVKVENRRGDEVGVVCKIKLETSESTRHHGEIVRRRIIAPATEAEKNYLLIKIRDEDRALSVCVDLVNLRQLAITIVDAEFSTDHKKLTFSYLGERRVDFRELIRDLFSIFKTRIWMQKLDTDGNMIHSSLPSSDPNSKVLSAHILAQLPSVDYNRVPPTRPRHMGDPPKHLSHRQIYPTPGEMKSRPLISSVPYVQMAPLGYPYAEDKHTVPRYDAAMDPYGQYAMLPYALQPSYPYPLLDPYQPDQWPAPLPVFSERASHLQAEDLNAYGELSHLAFLPSPKGDYDPEESADFSFLVT